MRQNSERGTPPDRRAAHLDDGVEHRVQNPLGLGGGQAVLGADDFDQVFFSETLVLGGGRAVRVVAGVAAEGERAARRGSDRSRSEGRRGS